MQTDQFDALEAAVEHRLAKQAPDCAECEGIIGSVREHSRPGTIFCDECAAKLLREGE